MNIFHLVCPNGLGHFKRTTEIWSELIDALDVNLTIACTNWQLEKSVAALATDKLLSKENVHFNFINPSGAPTVKFLTDRNEVNAYPDFKLRLAKNEFLRKADRVLSDNLVCPLDCHDQVSLIGSFLWHDVFQNSSQALQLKDIIDSEKELINISQPKMWSVGEFTMPEVAALPNNFGLNWLCKDVFQRKQKANGEKLNLLISPGLSGIDTQDLVKTILRLNDRGTFNIWLSPVIKGVKELTTLSSLKRFDFSEEGYKNIDLILCRPGVGSVTESIKYQIPILSVSEPDNIEMEFNTNRLEELGIGIKITGVEDMDYKRILLEYPRILKNLKERPVNGFEQLKSQIELD